MRMPLLPADFSHARPCKPFCEKSLTLPHYRLRGLGRSDGLSTVLALLGGILCTHRKMGWYKYIAPSHSFLDTLSVDPSLDVLYIRFRRQCPILLLLDGIQNTPCSIMASATRLKPAILAPATRL